ncbi:MAG: glucans biosynthesis glucosyltransferase MdoH, partial [Rubrivivax sp.]|nr:glucans biosynthesis glucosyltransferase MdoH [Rubrivivax sp.]
MDTLHAYTRQAARQRRAYTHDAAPPLQRGSMPPRPWAGFWRGLAALSGGRGGPARIDDGSTLHRAAARRRGALLACVAASALGAGGLLLASQPPAVDEPLRWLQVGLFTLLFAWVAAGFVTALMG